MLVLAAAAYPQGATSLFSGTVTDPQGAVIPAADVSVTNTNTGLVLKAATNEKGEWSIASVPPSQYSVTVEKAGFKKATAPAITINAGVPAVVNVRLELGQSTETITVEAGAEILQTESASLTSTMQARQVAQIPFATRNAVELMVTQPGVSTPTNPRSSSINGLPRGALNVTIDGVNTQDNLLKSSDGFFSYIYTPIDAVEEITLSTSATDSAAGGEGAANIRFVTRSGTNEYHGGAFWQNRNTFFNSNYYFNNINGLPRDAINLNQFGGRVGGPVIKNKLFFFSNFEKYLLPAVGNYTRQVLTKDALAGNFTYKGTDNVVHTVNMYDIAAKANGSLPNTIRPFATTPDPIIQSTLQKVGDLTLGGNIKSRIPTNNDYNRVDYNYQPPALNRRYFSNSRLDYNINSKNTLSVTYNYDSYFSAPDTLNNVVPIYSGTGTVLGSNVNTGQRSVRFAGIVSLRSAIKPTISNEFRGGVTGGTVLFFDALNQGLFSQWKGYDPLFAGTTPINGYIAGVTSSVSPQRRNSPVKTLSDNVSWNKGSHQISFGGNWTQVNLFQSTSGGSNSIIPGVTFGINANDPAFNGSTNMFVNANYPGISSTDQTNAQNLYAILTGRISSISRGVSLGDDGKYAFIPTVDRDRIRDYGMFAQDVWKFRPDLTLTFGLRYEKQLPFENLNNAYSVVGYAGLWGTSGIGNLFKPGATGGVTSAYTKINGSAGYSIPGRLLPSVGAAWQLPGSDGFLKAITGSRKGQSVLRLGFGVNSVREGSAVFQSILGSNQGVNINNGLDPSNFPTEFGPAGAAWFRDATLPSRAYPASPTYPLLPSTTTSLNDFDPKLKLGYVTSWNIGFQRELDKNTVVELRYTGNHGTSLWRQYNLNEVNIVENGFLSDFKNAMNNLALANGTTVAGLYTLPSLKSNNWGNAGLPGQVPLTILGNAIGNTTDATIATNLKYGQAGTAANAIATNPTRMANLQKAVPGTPANFFQVNPAVSSGGSYIVDNSGSSFYGSGQLELRRRLSKGFLIQGSYVWSKALANGATNSSSDLSQPTTLRDTRIDRLPSGFDIRHAFKLNGIWDLPFGPKRSFLGNVNNVVAKKVLEGWQLAGSARIQSGTPLFLNTLTAFGTFNQFADGVVLHNMDAKELQSLVGIYKSTASNGVGIVTFLPDSVINNTKAAFAQGGLTPATLDPNSKYIGPAAVGQTGYRGFITLPVWRFYNFSMIKQTQITERVNFELRAQCLNCFNLTNFQPNNNIGSAFGQTTAAYRDTSGTVDPGGRILEFALRLNF